MQSWAVWPTKRHINSLWWSRSFQLVCEESSRRRSRKLDPERHCSTAPSQAWKLSSFLQLKARAASWLQAPRRCWGSARPRAATCAPGRLWFHFFISEPSQAAQCTAEASGVYGLKSGRFFNGPESDTIQLMVSCLERPRMRGFQMQTLCYLGHLWPLAASSDFQPASTCEPRTTCCQVCGGDFCEPPVPMHRGEKPRNACN